MAAKDIFHAAVRQALIKEQWVITADPLVIKINKVKLEIDLAAEKIFAAQKAGRKIAVEVKSFVSSSVIFDFHLALGQFLNYRPLLNSKFKIQNSKCKINKKVNFALSNFEYRLSP